MSRDRLRHAPLVWDSDGDMLPDGWELQYGLNPCECATTNSPVWDADGDGLGLFDEYRYCTSPFTPDTDGDGVWDGDEAAQGSDPADASDGGDPANCVKLRLTVGDPSGSESERWNLDVFEEGAGRAVVCHCDDGFGTPGPAEYSLVKGKAYTFSLRWVATNLYGDPDYDWQAKINDSTEAGAREGLYGTGAFIVEDPDELLTECTYGGPNNLTVGKQGRIIVPKVEFKTYAKTVPGSDKPHNLNLDTRQNEDAHYAPYSKCVSHIWSGDALDMARYLDGYDEPDMRAIFHDVLKWQVNGSWQNSHELNLGNEPDSDEITRFNIGVAYKTGSDILDYLIVTVVPQSTQAGFNQWHATEVADMGWLAELPALYSSLTFDADGDPEDPEPGPCNFWNGPSALNSFYHPDGFFTMRSKKTAGGHGHQAIFRARADGGVIIKTGVSAGSADREAPFPEQLNPFLHVNADVKPFVWAAQLDGNPVEESGTTMTAPMLHEGVYLGRYLQVRPAVANALPDIVPGTCP